MHARFGHGETDNVQLDEVGKDLFGEEWRGVYAADDLPPEEGYSHCWIVNVDDRKDGGSHWLGCYSQTPRSTPLVFDSFARDLHKLMGKDFFGKPTESDIDQKIEETDCGQRSLAFLMVCHKHGEQAGKYV
jgi:hypothetical protein